MGSVTRPLRELKGFRRVTLEPGATETVRFDITAEELAFYRRDETWGTEPGRFRIYVGGDSRADRSVTLTLK